ncbi:MAG: hypothetical protein FK731_04730, partial [Asgard group archaeon]|nr:hypothetical protein [Asgard group archaeon]
MKIFGIWSNKINKRKFQQAVAYLKRNQNEKLEIVSFNEDCSFAYIFHPNEEFFLEKKKNEFKFIYPDQYSDEYLVNCKDSINSRSNSKTLDCNPLTITFTDNEIKIKSDYFG